MSEHNLSDALKMVYKKRAEEKMDIIEAIRMIFSQKGMDTVFDYSKLKAILWDVAPIDEIDRKRFGMIYESGAIKSIKAAALDAYHYKEHFAEAEKILADTGLGAETAHETAFILYDALGFPVDRPYKDPQRIDEDGHWTYYGEVKNGKQHGRGHEELIFDGMVYNKRDGLWIDGEVCGYLYSVEELGAHEYCFCENGMARGKVTHVWGDQIFVDEYK